MAKIKRVIISKGGCKEDYTGLPEEVTDKEKKEANWVHPNVRTIIVTPPAAPGSNEIHISSTRKVTYTGVRGKVPGSR
jgi:hypothetical protein